MPCLGYGLGFVAAAIAIAGCRAAMPLDLRSLSERTETLEAHYDRPGERKPILAGAGVGVDVGPFHLSRRPSPENPSGPEWWIEERGRTLVGLTCREKAGALMSNPPQSYHFVDCYDPLFTWRIHVDLFHGVRVDARMFGGPCFTPPTPQRRPAIVAPTKEKPRAIRLHECPTDAEEYRPGGLAAAAVVTDEEVVLMLPRREPARSLVASALLVALAFAPVDAIDEPRDLNDTL